MALTVRIEPLSGVRERVRERAGLSSLRALPTA